MFRLLSLRIVMIALSTISVCTILIAIFSFQWAKRTVQAEFIEVSNNYFRNSNEQLVQYMNSIEETAKVILNNPMMADEIRQPKVSMELQPVLDNLSVGLNLKVLGISIYKIDGTVYSLSRMSNMPPFQTLQENRAIRNFIGQSSEKSAWVIRDGEDGAGGTANRSGGTLTYLLKAFDDSGSLLGIMIVDLDAAKALDFFNTTNSLFRRSQTFLFHDGKNIARMLPDANKDALDTEDLDIIQQAPEGAFVSDSGDRLILFRPVLGSGTDKIVMDIPLENAMSKLHSLKVSLFLLTLLSSSLAVLLAVLLKRSIVRPLAELYKKIRAFL
ncbi:hypothetical protein [Paenibacillus hamazuiensis]|uniref:hypothetical protein n=1 Tax=Paenibacillus hamazuiensis TaxID=2936508 RepID=UPI00200C91DB|nr:hypothetical protein [Paenibacillus hamazuiensis]